MRDARHQQGAQRKEGRRRVLSGRPSVGRRETVKKRDAEACPWRESKVKKRKRSLVLASKRKLVTVT